MHINEQINASTYTYTYLNLRLNILKLSTTQGRSYHFRPLSIKQLLFLDSVSKVSIFSQLCDGAMQAAGAGKKLKQSWGWGKPLLAPELHTASEPIFHECCLGIRWIDRLNPHSWLQWVRVPSRDHSQEQDRFGKPPDKLTQ